MTQKKARYTNVTSNGHARDLVAYSDIPYKHRHWFDYLTPDEMSGDEARFFVYRGDWYDVLDSETTFDVLESSPLAYWSGFFGMTYWSAVVFRFTKDCEQVVVGYYYER